MVKGLDNFRLHFRGYLDSFVIIGGTACYLELKKQNLDFRTTKDIDLVLILELLKSDFSAHFWKFIQMGKYRQKQKKEGKNILYRFSRPIKEDFPYMIELFSRKSDSANLSFSNKITSIFFEDEASSLSAILLDEDYYQLILKGKCLIYDLPILTCEYLIPLKIKAFLDLSNQRASGTTIDSSDIKKHKNDIFRLYQILPMKSDINLPLSIKNDMRIFFEGILKEPFDIKNMGLKNTSLEDVVRNCYRIYHLV
jgi:hypothetical protein